MEHKVRKKWTRKPQPIFETLNPKQCYLLEKTTEELLYLSNEDGVLVAHRVSLKKEGGLHD